MSALPLSNTYIMTSMLQPRLTHSQISQVENRAASCSQPFHKWNGTVSEQAREGKFFSSLAVVPLIQL